MSTTATEHARALAAQRKRADRPCEWCTALMRRVTARRRYCCVACHDRAAYERIRQRRRSDRAD